MLDNLYNFLANLSVGWLVAIFILLTMTAGLLTSSASDDESDRSKLFPDLDEPDHQPVIAANSKKKNFTEWAKDIGLITWIVFTAIATILGFLSTILQFGIYLGWFPE